MQVVQAYINYPTCTLNIKSWLHSAWQTKIYPDVMFTPLKYLYKIQGINCRERKCHIHFLQSNIPLLF